jgi:Adaptin N terminal region
MLGYDMSWASFHVVEVMSSPKFHLKSVGYLAAAQSFRQDTDVLMLATNLLKKVNISGFYWNFIQLHLPGSKFYPVRHISHPQWFIPDRYV